MPKNVPLKLLTQGPVALRTRFKLGAPMYKCQLVQYPNSWPLFHKAIIYSRLQSLENEREHKRVSPGKRQGAISRSKRCNMQPKSGMRRVQQRSSVGKSVQSSAADFVTLKSLKGTISTQRKNIKDRKGTRNHRRTIKKGRHVKTRPRRVIRKAKKRRRGKRGGTKSKSRSRRRKGLKKRRRRNRARLSNIRRRLRRKLEQCEERSRRTLEVPPPRGHAQDGMLKQRNELNKEWFDTGKDEVREDPLNISDLCRRLVKSLPGNPADCREEFDEKTTKPERTEPQRNLHNFKAGSAGSLKTLSSESEDNTRMEKENNPHVSKNTTWRTCVKELKSLMKDHSSSKENPRDRLHVRRRTTQRLNSVNPVNKREKRSHSNKFTAENIPSESPRRKTKLAQNNHKQTTILEHKPDIIADRLEDKERCSPTDLLEKGSEKSQEKTLPAKDIVGQHEDKPSTADSTGIGKHKTREESIDGQKRHKTETKTVERLDTNSPSEYKRHVERHKRRVTGIQSRLETRNIDRLKAKHRRMRREYIKLIKTPRLRSKLLSKHTFRKRGHRSARKKAERKKSKTHRPMSVKHTKRTTCPSRHRPNYPKTSSKRRADDNGNVNNNVNNNINNNQTEMGIWCRVSGRLFRIGRYLLRKFNFFFW